MRSSPTAVKGTATEIAAREEADAAEGRILYKNAVSTHALVLHPLIIIITTTNGIDDG